MEKAVRRHTTRRIMGPVVIVALGVTTGATQEASADPGAIGAFERFGLLGTWSPRCSLPPSHLNPRVTWRVAGGVVVHAVTFDGRTVAVQDRVASADILAGHDMRIVEVREGGATLTVVVRLIGHHAWSMRSVGPDGHVFVEEGVEAATGKPTLVDERCEAVTS